jgi:hypothetical protein
VRLERISPSANVFQLQSRRAEFLMNEFKTLGLASSTQNYTFATNTGVRIMCSASPIFRTNMSFLQVGIGNKCLCYPLVTANFGGRSYGHKRLLGQLHRRRIFQPKRCIHCPRSSIIPKTYGIFGYRISCLTDFDLLQSTLCGRKTSFS